MLRGIVGDVLNALGRMTGDPDDIVLDVEMNLQFDKYSCGLQSLAAVMGYYDMVDTRAELEDALGLTRDGCDQDQMRGALRCYGLRHRTMRRGSIKTLTKAIKRHHPVVVALDDDSHWGVVYGCGEGSIYLMDPSLGKALRFIGRSDADDFLDRWDGYGIEVMPG